MAADALVTACPECGRRFLPPRVLCPACSLTRTVVAEPRPSATVLACSILRRTGVAALVAPPVSIALVREEGQGATFQAPVEGAGGAPEIGETVDIVRREWSLDEGGTFTGVVVRRRPEQR